MELEAHKKEQVQGVKFTISVLITLLILINGCNSQNIITGRWIDRTSPVITGVGIVYLFNKDNTFERVNYSHLDTKEKFKGDYLIKSDTLILEYLGYESSNLQQYIIKNKPIKSQINSGQYLNTLIANITVVNEKNEPFLGVNLMLRNENENPVVPFISDSEGKIAELNIYDRYINSFHFSFIGYQDVSINTQELFSYENNIKVILYSDSLKYNTTTFKEKYFIKKFESKEMLLLSLDNNKRRIWILGK